MRIPFFGRLFEKRSTLVNPDQYLKDYFSGGYGGDSNSGVAVNSNTAIKFSPYFAGVNLIAQSISTLPLITYRRLKRGKERAYDHPLFYLLHDQPNEEMTSVIYREISIWNLLNWGDIFSEIVYKGNGTVDSIWPLLPWRMRIDVINGRRIYLYTPPDGNQTVIPNRNIMHIPGLSFDGVRGSSVIAYARESIGLGLALEEFGARFFSNNTNLGAIVEHPKSLSEQAIKNLRESLNEKYQGLGKSHRLLILEEGMKYAKNSIPPNDAQFLETRKFEVEEVARWLNIPKHLLKDLSGATFSNIEQQFIEFVILTLRPWLVRYEQGILKDLFIAEEKKQYFSEFLVEGLLRGDTLSRFQSYAIARQWGWYSANDIREMENQNPIDGGDVYLIPLNMMDAKTVNEQPQVPQQTNSYKLGSIEQRSLRSATLRLRIARSYIRLFEDPTLIIVKRERADILDAAKRIFAERSFKNFEDFIEQFYRDKEEYIGKQFKPAMLSLSDQIAEAATQEINSNRDHSRDIDKFMNEYAIAFEKRYTGSSKGQILQITQKALDEEQDPIPILTQRFDEWEEKRPGKVADNETIKIAGAISSMVFGLSGVTKLIWVNTGSKSCPYCEELNGQVVGIEKPFKKSGDEFKPGGADKSMSISTNVFHPPLHETCQCMISAG
ncbi:MAG: phage portal protein [Candidatus Humimicrobiaceae bacterium]